MLGWTEGLLADFDWYMSLAITRRNRLKLSFQLFLDLRREMRKRHLLLGPFQLIGIFRQLLRTRVIESNVPLLVPRGANIAILSRTIIETVGVGLLAFRTMMPWPRPLFERSIRLLGHMGQKGVVILINVVLLDPVIGESIALHKGVNMASLDLGGRLMMLWLFNQGPILFLLWCTLPILSAFWQELCRGGLNQVTIPLLLVLVITILKKETWIVNQLCGYPDYETLIDCIKSLFKEKPSRFELAPDLLIVNIDVIELTIWGSDGHSFEGVVSIQTFHIVTLCADLARCCRDALILSSQIRLQTQNFRVQLRRVLGTLRTLDWFTAWIYKRTVSNVKTCRPPMLGVRRVTWVY